MIVTVVILFLIRPLIGFQNKEASGTFSELAIAEIDEDKYFIDEYDGRETVVTPADLSWEVIDEYDDMMVAAAPPVDVCWTGIE